MSNIGGLLAGVEKPARYIGGEVNMCVKSLADIETDIGIGIRFGFCFPDLYEIGMSHLGLSILYSFINRRTDSYCERVFMPWLDMERNLRENGKKLFSLETQTPMSGFDMLGFTLQYEMSYSNILHMLDLGGVGLFSKERGEDEPIVCAGGPCAYNPEPIADFFDFFYIGEGEVYLDAVLDMFIENKAAGGSKKDFLKMIAGLDGIYVPAFYDEVYEDGVYKGLKKNDVCAKDVIEKVVVDDLDAVYFPDRQIVPYIETVHDRVVLELFRGCIRGCRFCQAGFVYRPVREKVPETLSGQAKALLDSTGHEEISLVSLSSGDYTRFRELAEILMKEHCGGDVNLSLPSLRVDAFTLELMEKAQGVRKSGLTFAPEAGSQRLRDVINKNITEDEILKGCGLAFSGGWDKLKLYFMIGLPGEDVGDVRQISNLCNAIIDEYYKLPREARKRPVSLNVSASCFVPKPFTPFQWARQDSADEFIGKQQLLKSILNKKNIRFSYHHPYVSVIEGVLARGDRRLGRVLYNAYRLGAKFEGWSEHFKYDIWDKAFLEAGICIEEYTRERSYDEALPWDHISVGVSKEFLMRENEKARKGLTTPDCRTECSGCGVAKIYGGKGCVSR